MARLPIPGKDNDVWGGILNDYLLQQHNGDGTHRLHEMLGPPGVRGRVLYTDPLQPDGIAWQALGSNDVGLGRVDNTADLDKPISTATKSYVDTGLAAKADENVVLHKAGSETVTGAKVFNSGTLLDKGTHVYNVRAFGAVGDGVVDDATALQQAITAATANGGTVFIPTGTYQINTTLTFTGKLKIEGAGHGSILRCSAGNDLCTWTTNIAWLELYNIQMQATGGHIFAPQGSGAHFNASEIHHCWFVQNSADKAVWYQTAANLIELTFRQNDVYVAGASRTVPAWYNLDQAGGCNSNWWENNVFTYGDACGNQPFIYVESKSSQDYSYDNHWVNNVFETCDGGCLKLLSLWGSIIDGNYSYDNISMAAPAFYLGKGSTGLASTHSTLRQVGRIGQHVQAGVADIYLEASTRQVVIDNFRCSPDNGTIELNNAADVYLTAMSPGTTITHANGVISMRSGGVLAAQTIVPAGVVTLSDAATIMTDASRGNHFRVTLAGNRTLATPSNPTDGQRCVWELIQDATGSRSITLDTGFALGSTVSSVVLSAAPGAHDFIGAIYNAAGGTWHVVAFAGGYA